MKKPTKKVPMHPDAVLVAKAGERERQHLRQIKDLVRQVREATARQEFIDAASSASRKFPRIVPRERTSGLRELTAVALASDWHVEEPVEPCSVAFVNEYNLEIAEARSTRFFQGILWNLEHQRASKRLSIRDLVLWLGGDLMTGYIHPELIENNLLSPTETVRWLLPHLAAGIKMLLAKGELEKIVVPCSFGNHGRTTDKSRVTTGYANSYEWLMYHSLADIFVEEPRVRFEITNSNHQYVEVYNRTCHFTHGDSVRYQGGVGGIGIPLLKAVAQWDQIRRCDYHNVGHFHQLTDFGRLVVNGSLIGYGPYSQLIRASFEVPQQAMYYIDSKRGKCMTTAIWVSDSTEKKAKVA